ncbi:ATP:cob(I)alamin adenosyltransferase [Salmonella enterica subsp. enterica serovar 4,[5],12:b:-]|nr:ATP:cob(I)alamin adenosyltransferase [Salmonella enterica subsp. enterica serovar 4,[5],12:b:-]
MAIYTRTGDAGTTSLFTGQRVSKTHPRVEAYGTLDELNAALSLCACAAADENHRTLLEAIQQQLFWFSAELASDSEQPSPKQRYISSEEISALEAAIDRAMARAEDSDAHQANIIREVSKRYLAASQPTRSKETTPVALSFHDLHQLTRAAVERAQQLQVPVVVSIVDAHGTETVTWRMPDALLVSSELAPKKAWTAVAMKTATHELSDVVQPGAALYGLESHLQGKVVTFGGGYALWRDGILIGGLGISGGSVEQDMDIAQTAIAAINVGTHQ